MKTIALVLFAAASLSTAFAGPFSPTITLSCSGVVLGGTCTSTDGIQFVSGRASASETLSNFSFLLGIDASAQGGYISRPPADDSLSLVLGFTLNFYLQAIGSGPGTALIEYGGGEDFSTSSGGGADVKVAGFEFICNDESCSTLGTPERTEVTLGQPFEISVTGYSAAGCYNGITCEGGGVDLDATIKVVDQFGNPVPLVFAAPEPGTTPFMLCGGALGWLYFRRTRRNPQNRS